MLIFDEVTMWGVLHCILRDNLLRASKTAMVLAALPHEE
jgi:hypothetical protein